MQGEGFYFVVPRFVNNYLQKIILGLELGMEIRRSRREPNSTEVRVEEICDAFRG